MLLRTHENRNRKITSIPSVPVDIDVDVLAKKLRTARGRAVASPSGTTVEHLNLLSKSQFCTEELFAETVRAPEILCGIRLGHITALQKYDGGAQSILAGNAFGKLVTRTLVKQFGSQVECATPVSTRPLHRSSQ